MIFQVLPDSSIQHSFFGCFNYFLAIITDTRQALLAARNMPSELTSMADILNRTSDGIQELVKSVLLNLKVIFV